MCLCDIWHDVTVDKISFAATIPLYGTGIGYVTKLHIGIELFDLVANKGGVGIFGLSSGCSR